MARLIEFANNHRTRCNLNPIDALEAYNPQEDLLKDVCVVEKTGTEQGWSRPAPDEPWQHGYPQEFQDFMESISGDREPLSNGALARETTTVLYSAYVSAEHRRAEVEIPNLGLWPTRPCAHGSAFPRTARRSSPN